MCELFGFSSRSERPINTELKEFFSHSNRHPDGWGLVVLDDDHVSIEKEPVAASKSTYLKERLHETIETKKAMAHIRLATIGTIDRQNAHPFMDKDCSGRRWTLMHNGTIFDFPKLGKYGILQKGTTDSERILYYILDEIKHETAKKGEALDVDERFDVLDRVVYDMSEGNKLNLLIYDGEWMYAHYNAKDTLYVHQNDSEVMIATTPLSGSDWEPMPFTRLLAYKNGEMILEGTDHGHVFTEDKKSVNELFMTYSEL